MCHRDRLFGLHPYAPAIFPHVALPAKLAQPYPVQLTSLSGGASVFAWNEGGLAITAARAGVLYRSGPRVRAEAVGEKLLSQAEAIRWMQARQRRSAWETA
jgi:hypothetical protein